MSATRPLGSTGVEIAPLALGAMNFGIATPPDEAAAMLTRAIDAGITLVDTADVYRESEHVDRGHGGLARARSMVAPFRSTRPRTGRP